MNSRLPEFRECFARLIAAPSVSCADPKLDMSNRAVVDLLAGWLSDLGFNVDLVQVSTNPEKVDLVAVLGEGPGGLALSGHTDTVPFDEHGWCQDPFMLCQRDDRYYGLGTSDMKGFFALVLETLSGMDLKNLKQPLYLLATSDEESTMAGAVALVESGRSLARYALIGEPTGLQPVYLHKGVMMETIRLIGRSGHASNPSLGVSALEGMHRVIGALLDMRRTLQAQHRDPRFAVPEPTMNLGSVHGGDSPNRICAECELMIDLRPLPGMDLTAIRAEIRRRAMEAVDGYGLVIEFEPAPVELPALETPRTSEIVREAERLAGTAPTSVCFGTEGPFFNAAGMDTVVLGPGDIDQAHQPNEYLHAGRIAPMQHIVEGMIHHFCIKEAHHDC